MMLLAQRDRAVGQRLEAELAEVGTRLGAELVSDLPCVNSLVEHLERYHGKMLRPTLVLITGMASSGSGLELTQSHRVIATVAEMVHLATLVHDDVLDEAQIRRRGATINHLKGNEAAVMLGDYLISHAYHLCSSLSNTVASRLIAETTNTICEGELLQLANRGNLLLDEQTYFEIIRRKTASLCGTCCRLGGLMSGVSSDAGGELYTYGEKLGVAYQIVDDVLDLVGSEATVGKTLGQDVQKGKLTLPLIRFFQLASSEHRRSLQDLLQPCDDNAGLPLSGSSTAAPDLEDPDRTHAIRQLIGLYDCVNYAQQWAHRLVDQAKSSLNGMIASPARGLLLDMADVALTRKF